MSMIIFAPHDFYSVYRFNKCEKKDAKNNMCENGCGLVLADGASVYRREVAESRIASKAFRTDLNKNE